MNVALVLKKNKRSMLSALRQLLVSLKVLPAVLNRRSLGTLVGGAER
jgi:hypothetical protein